jgi:[acyl-carrier-protein] S-malonyltransferase
MFSGQGSQYVGMCQELYNEYDSVKVLFHEASAILGYDTVDIMFNDSDKLNNTLYTQPLMFVMYASILEILKEKDIKSDYSIGLSLGEYGALYDASCFDFKTALKILEKRGLYMAEACTKTTGKMSAILGMDADALEQIISDVDGYSKIANYNTYGQLVISGEESTVLKVNELALNDGAKRAILLNTSGPFHTNLMSYASDRFENYLKDIKVKEPKKQLLLNTTGDFYTDGIKYNMVKQITSSVMFYQMIEKLLDKDVDTFIEIGPKKSLCSFVKKINRQVNILNIEDIKSLEKTLLKLEEQQ